MAPGGAATLPAQFQAVELYRRRSCWAELSDEGREVLIESFHSMVDVRWSMVHILIHFGSSAF